MKKQISLFVLVAWILSSCHSTHGFTKRRYTAGHYQSRASKTQKAPAHPTNETVRLHTPTPTQQQQVQPIPAPVLTLQKSAQTNQASSAKPNTHPTLVAHAKTGSSANSFTSKKTKFLPLSSFQKKDLRKSGSPTTAPGDKSTLGVFLAGLGIVLDVTGLLVAVVAMEYFFVAFTVAGLVCGLFALLFGVKGLSLYRKEKSNGTKHTKTLVFSIISTALGSAAILLGLVYTLMGLIILSL